MKNTIVIDGSKFEGGGSILRTSVPLAIITQTPTIIKNIRKKRPNPGLREQHLKGIHLIAKLTNSKLKGDYIGSTEVQILPGNQIIPEVDVTVTTAGSIPLLLQMVQNLAIALSEPITITIHGGATYGKWAPTIDYVFHVLIPALERIGLMVDVRIENHGFYPKGGAKAIIHFQPRKPGGFLLENTRPNFVNIISVASKHLEQANVAERQAYGAQNYLEEKGYHVKKISHEYFDTPSIGSAVLVYHTSDNYYLGASNLGEKGVKAEVIGKKAAQKFTNYLQAAINIDDYLSDQLLLPVLVKNVHASFLTSKLTCHAKTNLWVLNQFFTDRQWEIIPEKNKMRFLFHPS